MRVYIDLDENIDNISELHACIKTRDDKYISAGGDIKLWAMEKTGWIPVSERLPEASEYIGDVARYYLVQNEYGDILVARYTHGEYWEQIYQLKPIGDQIVAWQPLPQPYKGESEDEE